MIFTYSQTAAQYYNKGQFKVSVLLEGTASAMNYGLTPSLSFGNDCHELQIGPRITQDLFGNADGRKQFLMDVGYRLNYFHSRKDYSLFTSFRPEIGKTKYTEEWIYSPDDVTDWRLEFGDVSKEMITKSQVLHVNLHIGVGIQHEFYSKIFLKAEAGYGLKITSENHEHYFKETNELNRVTGTLMDVTYHSWIASLGVGYRFN